jgi:hypothetical protein
MKLVSILCFAFLITAPIALAVDHREHGNASNSVARPETNSKKSEMPLMRKIPPFAFKNAQIVQKTACINGVTLLRIKRGARIVELIFSPKVSMGDIDSVRIGNKVSGRAAKEYFCIKQVLPLIMYPGALIESIR